MWDSSWDDSNWLMWHLNSRTNKHCFKWEKTTTNKTKKQCEDSKMWTEYFKSHCTLCFSLFTHLSLWPQTVIQPVFTFSPSCSLASLNPSFKTLPCRKQEQCFVLIVLIVRRLSTYVQRLITQVLVFWTHSSQVVCKEPQYLGVTVLNIFWSVVFKPD